MGDRFNEIIKERDIDHIEVAINLQMSNRIENDWPGPEIIINALIDEKWRRIPMTYRAVRILRMQGIGYKRIASRLELTEYRVKQIWARIKKL